MEDHEEIEFHKYQFQQQQVRLINFYAIKSAFGESPTIKTPEDLYTILLDNDIEDRPALPFSDEEKQRMIEILDNPDTKWETYSPD